VLVTGDIVDNAERSELAQARAVLDGGRVDPDTGTQGYRGPQEAANPDPLYYRPDQDAPRHPGLLAAAQRPFTSPGLDAPWLPALGNHDVLRQGELPPARRTDAVATGTRLVTSLDRDFTLPEDEPSAVALDRLLDAGTPGAALRVPADPGPGRAAPGADGGGARARPRAPRAGITRLRGGRRRHPALPRDRHRRPGGRRARAGVERPGRLGARAARGAGGRDVVLVSHNRLDRLGAKGAAALLAAVDASPRRARRASPATPHRNRIRPRRTAAGGHWVIETSSLADFPQQGRMLRVRETVGGGRVIETWMVDQDGGGLAGIARELAYLDAQGGRPQGFAGTRQDRNARLHLPPRR
jgi:hypothetical protein